MKGLVYKMKKQIFKTISVVLVIVIISIILFFTNAFFGNPISKMLATNSINKYVNEKYGDLDLELEKTFYNFKSNDYNARAVSKTSIDTHFMIRADYFGNIKGDDYENVTGKFNTWIRVNDSYRDLVKPLTDKYGKDTIAYGEIEIDLDSNNMDVLEIDMKVDIKSLAIKYGKLVICLPMNYGEVNEETMAKNLLEIKSDFDKAEVPFAYIDFQIFEKYDKNGNEIKPGTAYSLNILNYPYSEINGDNLLEKIKIAIKDTREHYEKMDKELK